jgi:hypothetical protein
LEIARNRGLLADLLDPETRHLAASMSAGGEGQKQNGQIAGVDEPVGATCREQPVEHVARDSSLALALPGSGAGPDRQPDRRAKTGRMEQTLLPFPQRCSVPQFVSRRFTVDGACGPSVRSSKADRMSAAISAGIPCCGSLSRLAGSHK